MSRPYEYQLRSHALPRNLSQSHQELHHVQEVEGGEEGTGHNQRKMLFGREYKTYSGNRRATSSNATVRSHDPNHLSTPMDPIYRSNALQSFDDSGSDTEDGGSQPWEVSDIQITIDDVDNNTINSTASTSTLIGENNPPRTAGGKYMGSMSQEPFDDEAEIMPLTTLAEGIPMSSQPHYYDQFEQESGPPNLTRHGSHQGLSQPPAPRNKYGRHRMSLSDLSSLANSTTNLTHSQYLSQSVVEVRRYAHRGDTHGSRFPDPRPRHSQSYSLGNLHRLTSDPYLNAWEGPPGQKRSILAAMNSLREDPAVKQRRRNQHHHYHQGTHTSSSSSRNQPSQRRQQPHAQNQNCPTQPPLQEQHSSEKVSSIGGEREIGYKR